MLDFPVWQHDLGGGRPTPEEAAAALADVERTKSSIAGIRAPRWLMPAWVLAVLLIDCIGIALDSAYDLWWIWFVVGPACGLLMMFGGRFLERKAARG